MYRIKFSLSEMLVFSHFNSRLETSIPDLARHFNVHTSTVVGIVSKLERRGLISKASTLTGKRGRPKFLYRLRIPQPIFTFIFEMGQVTGAVLDTNLKIKASEILHFERIKNLDHAKEQVIEIISRFKSSPELVDLNPQGLSFSISAIHSRGRIVSLVMPWKPLALEESLTNATGLPSRLVFSPNLLAVYQKLPTPIPESFVFLHVGDGMSAHSVIRGSIYRGAASLAGEIGHFSVDPEGSLCGCGQRGCLETCCSGPAILHQVLEGLESGVVSTLDLKTLASSSPHNAAEYIWTAWLEGDSFIRSLMDRVFDRIGWALGIVVNVLDPYAVTIGGYMFSNKKNWFDEVIRRSSKWILNSAKRNTAFFISTVEADDVLRVAGTSYFYERAMQEKVAITL